MINKVFAKNDTDNEHYNGWSVKPHLAKCFFNLSASLSVIVLLLSIELVNIAASSSGNNDTAAAADIAAA